MPPRVPRRSFLGATRAAALLERTVEAVPPRSTGRAAAISSVRFAAQDGREAARRDTAHLYQRPS